MDGTVDPRGARRRAVAAAVAACIAASALLPIALAGLAPAVLTPPAQLVLVLAVAAVPLGCAVLVSRADPGNASAALLALAGLCAVATCSVEGDAVGPFAGSWMLLYLAFALLLLVVPDGRMRSRRWRAVGAALVIVVAGFVALCALQWAAPATVEPTMPVALALLAAFLGLLIASAVAPIARYRRADADTRMRLRWVFLSGASLPFTLLLCWSSYLLIGTADLVGVGLIVMYTAIPLGVAVAIARPTLFDVDRATVTTATAAVLAGGALVLLSIACGIAGVTLVRWSSWAAIAVMAAVTGLGALSYPALRRAIDRALYPERGRAVAALVELQRLVGEGDDAGRVQEVLRGALRDPELRVAYRRILDHRLVDLDGVAVEATGPTSSVLHWRGEEVGAILPGPARVTRVAVSIARAAAPLVDAVRLHAEMERSRAEVAASRERILRAGYEERRLLERDLHDGAQQRLVALGMRLRVLQRDPRSGDGLSAELDTVVAELATAVAELRRIAHGMRPVALDDGLGAALTALTRTAPELIELDVQAPELPDAVATTAYFVVSEAVANALRHAGASRIRITARTDDRELLALRVDDDGCGGAALTPHGGLTGLADRVAALGGRLELDSRPGHGTTLEARIPCGS